MGLVVDVGSAKSFEDYEIPLVREQSSFDHSPACQSKA